MDWIYLSPHLDDVVYSCGGQIWEQVQAGCHVEIWTICAADPPDGPLTPLAETLHARWQTGREATVERRAEDLNACRLLGAVARHFSIPDCIYRRLPDGRPVITVNDDLFRPPHPGEAGLVAHISQSLAQVLPPNARLVAPLGLGSHVDHVQVRSAAEALGLPLWLYADMPYALMYRPPLERWVPRGWTPSLWPVSPAGMRAWQSAMTAYRSQVSTFWRDEAELRARLESYWRTQLGAHALWTV